ncbi:MAG: SxtJ family membrane protein [Pyrinomonadaceae bacterium]
MIEPKGSVTQHDDAGVTYAQARKSALLVAAVLLAIAAWNVYRGRPTIVIVFGSLGAALLVAGLLVPPAARAFHTAWMHLAEGLAYVNSRVLLTLMYYVGVTPYGLVSRLAGRDPLRRRAPRGESYWVERKRTRQERARFERLF